MTDPSSSTGQAVEFDGAWIDGKPVEGYCCNAQCGVYHRVRPIQLAPSTGQPGEVADVLDTTMEPVDAARSVPLAPAGLDRPFACFHGVVVSTGQPGAGVDLRAVRRRIVELVGLMDAEPFTRILDSAEYMLREVQSLRQQLAADQVDRKQLFQHGLSRVFDDLKAERDQLRAQVVWLKQEHADMHPACSAEPGHCPHEAQVEAMRGVVEAARELIAAPPCQRGHMSFGHETCTPAGDGCDLHRWHMLKHAVSNVALDAASAGQPASSSDRGI